MAINALSIEDIMDAALSGNKEAHKNLFRMIFRQIGYTGSEMTSTPPLDRLDPDTITTVAALPSAAAYTGQRLVVTDATTPAIGATVAGSGAVTCEVISNGTNWKVI
jgi:hypothetical protein